VAADFAHYQDGFGLRVLLKEAQHVHEVRAGDGVAADADTGRLAQADIAELPDALVSQRAAAADKTDRAGLVDVAGHDADFALAGSDDAWAIGADEPARFALKKADRASHVQHGHAFGDGDDDADAGVGGFHDGVGGAAWRHED